MSNDDDKKRADDEWLRECRSQVSRLLDSLGTENVLEAMLWYYRPVLVDSWDKDLVSFYGLLETAMAQYEQYLRTIGYNTPQNIQQQIDWLEEVAKKRGS